MGWSTKSAMFTSARKSRNYTAMFAKSRYVISREKKTHKHTSMAFSRQNRKKNRVFINLKLIKFALAKSTSNSHVFWLMQLPHKKSDQQFGVWNFQSCTAHWEKAHPIQNIAIKHFVLHIVECNIRELSDSLCITKIKCQISFIFFIFFWQREN